MDNLSKEEKIEYLKKYAECQNKIPEKEIRKFKDLVEEGCEKNWPVALNIKAYGSYGGSDLFECDWEAAEASLLKLAELTGEGSYYNSLGYIYYYGRLTGGKPDYEKAFKYFSVGAAQGIYESRYKLADMFLSGKGCIKNAKGGANIILSMYGENKDLFSEEKFDCKFADIAFRVGGLFERGDGVKQDYGEALSFYNEALLAITARIKNFDFYGDERVKKNIDEARARVYEKLPVDYFDKLRISMKNPVLLGDLLSKSVGLDITFDHEDNGYILTAKSFKGEGLCGKTLVNISSIAYCELVDEITLHFPQNTKILSKIGDLPYRAFITQISHKDDLWLFNYRDMTQLSLKVNECFFVNDRLKL